MVAKCKLTKRDCPSSSEDIAEMHNVPYQKAVGSLMHIAVHSRPDIAYSVQQVS